MTLPTPYVQPVYLAGYDQPIASLLRFILQKIVKTFEAQNVPLPENRLVTVGSVAVDHELLAVMFGGVAVGPPGNELNQPLRGDAPRSAMVNVELWRSAPALSDAGQVPSSEEISAAAEIAMQDSWLLLEAAYASDQMGVGIIASAAVNEPNGEMQGVTLALQIQIP